MEYCECCEPKKVEAKYYIDSPYTSMEGVYVCKKCYQKDLKENPELISSISRKL